MQKVPDSLCKKNKIKMNLSLSAICRAVDLMDDASSESVRSATFLERGLGHSEVLDRAERGHLDIVGWCVDYGSTVLFDPKLCETAALNGRLEVLAWARDRGSPCVREYLSINSVCASAALNGHLDVLRWARENGCPWDKYTCIKAAQNGHTECLQWARENGCPE